ncbi:hypothetical protein, variant 1 [Aphanomyces invadans]|uniref:Endonuclease/exonuclease/phosphatase domain-containing protein n=1 Tax=Aphanomyces invadans TaxID=157072 RepID=A0A024UI19_9STRA|nr:hypothetical protein, variant 1 [Aphanomyces invadans]ETW05899.1 hypothetical protein, variant 1 [Aphanomyces invadans]|eukprot:XP_008865676.1 hypothetical protein, variant 1 [Aphanomyces invadans]
MAAPSTQEPPWHRMLAMLAAHTASSLVFWALLDQLPRDVYWFCLEEMNLSNKLAFLGVLFALPVLLLSRRVRLAAAQYGSVLDMVGLLCLFVRFHPHPTLHVVTCCLGLVAVTMARCSLWSFAFQLHPMSVDGSVTDAALSVTGVLLANFVTLALRWGNKSLNPLVPGLASALVTAVVCLLPVAIACIYLYFHRRRHHEFLGPPSFSPAQMPWWQAAASMAGLPLVVFVTQWVLGSPTSIARWLGVSTDWSWAILLVFLGGTVVAQVIPGFAIVALWTAGLLCFGASSTAALQLAGAVCMASMLPSLWLGLVSPTTYHLPAMGASIAVTNFVVVNVTSASQDPAHDMPTSSPHLRGDSQGHMPKLSLPSSVVSSGLCFTSCLGTMVYILLTALTIILTCYDYLTDELRSLRGQRYQILVGAGLVLSISNALMVLRSRTQRRCRLVTWNTMCGLRAVVAGALLVGVLGPVAIVRLAFNHSPGAVLPPIAWLGVRADLRVFSFNVYQGFNRAGLNNFEPILNAIKDYQPTMVALQESDTMQAGSGAIDITDYLGQNLGMYSYSHPRTDQDSFGCSFLSVFPILESESMGVILPSPRGENACMQVRGACNEYLEGLQPVWA